MRRAKVAAIERGSTLRDLVAKALRRELSVSEEKKRDASTLPAIRLPADAPILRMSAQAMKEALAGEDEADDIVRTG